VGANQHAFLLEHGQVTTNGCGRHLQPVAQVGGGYGSLRGQHFTDLEAPLFS